LSSVVDDHRATLAADAGIDDHDVHGPVGEKWRRRREAERGRGHVVRRDVVREVDDVHPRECREDHALHRANVPVDRPEIGQQRDDRHDREGL
jgi:hypothetical protein